MCPLPLQRSLRGPNPWASPHAVIDLRDGSQVPGTIVASSQTDMVVVGDDCIERKILLTQIQSVEYSEAQKAEAARQPSGGVAPPMITILQSRSLFAERAKIDTLVAASRPECLFFGVLIAPQGIVRNLEITFNAMLSSLRF